MQSRWLPLSHQSLTMAHQIVNRYNIVSEADLAEAARRMEARVHSEFIQSQDQETESTRDAGFVTRYN
jgi:hypothetical protein